MPKSSLPPKITVIIPAHNAAPFIADALDSVFAQTLQPFEVIVVDDHSTDKTAAIVKHDYPTVKLLTASECGVANARNVAIISAEGDYIANLDADDLWLPNKLEKQAAALEDKRILFAQTQNWITEPDGQRKMLNMPSPHDVPTNSTDLLLFWANLPGSSWLVPTKTFNEVGLFDATMHVGEDVDFFIRAMLGGYSLFLVEELLCLRRIHDSNLMGGKYIAGLTVHWNVINKYVLYRHQGKLTDQDIDPDIAAVVALVRFFMRGFYHARGGQVRPRWLPYRLMATCFWLAITHSLVWVGSLRGLYRILRYSHARTNLCLLRIAWARDRTFFNAASKDIRAS